VTSPFELVGYRNESGADDGDGTDTIEARIRERGVERVIAASGNGPIDAFTRALREHCGVPVRLRDYHEHAMSGGANATAAAYVDLDVDDVAVWGVGIHPNIVTASLRAILSAVNRAEGARALPALEEAAEPA
jgi:2-isopropylmalate synthase